MRRYVRLSHPGALRYYPDTGQKAFHPAAGFMHRAGIAATMAVPGRVEAVLGDEEVETSVPLGDDGGLFTTPTRTITYRESTLLRDESVETFPNDAERLSVSEGRRKATLTLGYRDGTERTMTVPADDLAAALPAVLEGILDAGDVLEPDEGVERTDRFDELTLVVTTRRLVKHVGEAVWDRDVEEVPFDRVRDVRTEEGAVATQLVLELEGGRERIKVPRRAARLLVDDLEAAVCAYHGVADVEALRERFAPEESADDTGVEETFAEGLEPLTPRVESGGTAAVEDSSSGGAARAVAAEPDLAEEVAALREAVERHETLLERHGELLERLEERLDDRE